MTGKFISLLKNASWFFYIDLLGMGLAIALLPLYTAYLSPADYGIVALCFTATAIIGGFNSLGLPQFAGRLLYRFHNKKKHLSILLGNIYAVTFILLLATSGVLSLFPSLIHRFFYDNSQIPASVILFVPIWLCFFRTISEILKDYQVINQLGRNVFIFSISRNISLHVLKIIALVVFKLGVVGFLMAELIVEALIATSSAILLVYLVRPKLNFRKMRLLKIGLSYSLPYIPNNLSSWIIQYIDRILLLKLSSMWNVGLYSFAMGLATSAFGLAWNPVRSGICPEIPKQLDNLRQNPDAHKNTAEFLYASTLFLAFIVLGLSTLGKHVVWLLANERFHSSYILLGLLGAFFAIQNIREIVQFPIMIKNKTFFFPLSTFLGAVVNTVANILLIPLWGTIGAAAATVFTNLVLLACAFIYAQHLVFINYNYILVVAPLLFSILLALPSVLVPMGLLASGIWAGVAVITYVLFGRYYLMRACPRIYEKISSILCRNNIVRKTGLIKLIELQTPLEQQVPQT